MLYYSKEARESALNSISDLQKKIGEIPGNVLSYTDARTLSNHLSLLVEEIKKEQARMGE